MDDSRAESREVVLPLTAAQRGLWFAQKLDPDNPSYNVAQYAVIPGPVDLVRLREAVRHVARETEAMRLTFGERDGVPHQRVSPHSGVEVPSVDLSGHQDPAGEARRLMAADLAAAADPAAGPLVRMTLYRLAADRHFFHQQVHHLALDGYSAVLALGRIADAYTRLTLPDPEPLASLPAPLGPLVDEDRAYESSGLRAADKEFWAGHLDGAPPAVGLAEEEAAAPGHGFRAVSGEIGAAGAERLRTAARASGVAWPTFFMAAVAAYLQRNRGVREVVLGLPVTGRRTAVSRTTPGMLSNILPLRLRVSPSDRVCDVAKRASAGAREVLRHQRYPAEDLRHDRGLSGAGGRLVGPSVNVLAFDDTLRFGPHTATLHNLSVGPVDDLVVAVHASYGGGGLRIDLLGNPRLYTQRELESHHDRLLRLVESFTGDPTRQIGSLRTVGDPEQRRLIALASGDSAEPGSPQAAPATGTLPEQFAAQARERPLDTAVVSGGVRLTFGALEARVNSLAARLAAIGAGPGTRVAVGLPRSAELVVAMLAVMRTGAAYVPLDPTYPADRLAHMIEDSRPVALVATRESADRTDPAGALPLVEPGAADPLVPLSTPTDAAPPGPRDSAYVIYTSGSTGRPKGVVVEHRSLTNLLAHHRREAHALAERALGRRLRVALTAATSFDASWDPVLWMLAGHELHIVDDETRRDPEALVAFLVDRRIDAIETTPSYLRQMITAGLLGSPVHRPQVIALGGEAVDPALWSQLANHRDLLVFNFYGPTEATVDAVTTRISGGTPTIGRPVSGARAYVLDSALHPLPVGTTGELYLAGEGVARGYEGAPGLTADRFLPDPFGARGGRMYRTGDLASWSDDGTLEFAGRSDQQIKIRGQRVETGEIESALRSLPGVDEAAVTLTGPAGGGVERLAAYLVSRAEPAPVFADIRDALRDVLPEHMVPTAYAAVERLPLTPNGKLDPARLPHAAPVAARAGGEPRTPEEAAMCALFAECLDLPRAGRDDSFFALGGHSLLATRLVSLVRAHFGVELPIRSLFEAPTPAGLAALLDTAHGARPAVTPALPRPARIPLSFAQQRLWLIERMGEGGRAYHLPVALRLTGSPDRAALAAALDDVVRRHESLRTVFAEDDEGPHQRVLAPDDIRVPLLTPGQDAAHIRTGGADFALDRDLPLRAELTATGPDSHLLVLTLHHIAADGWSMGPLLHDLSHAYTARRAGAEPGLDPLPVQYADYALWQRTLLGDPADPRSLAGSQLEHWSAALDGLPAEISFPADRPRPARPSGRGATVPFRIDAATHRALVDLAAHDGASTFMVLHTALAALLARLGAGEDIAVGTPVAGRTDESLAELVGFFVNTLVLRTDTSGTPDFHELLSRTRDADLSAYAHQELPFERLVEALNPPRTPARHPLFQVMISLNNAPAPVVSLPGLKAEHDPAAGRTGAKFDLTWDLAEHHDAAGAPAGITGELEYSEDLFERASAERFADHYTRLLTALLHHPDRPVADAEFLTDTERTAALGDPENDRTPSRGRPIEPADTLGTVVDVLTTQAVVTPGRTAVVDAGGALSFGDLHDRTEQLALLLHESGIRHGDRVAVALPRTSLHIVALLAVLRAGAVHVPLDPSHPHARNRLILDTAAPALVLTTAGTAGALPATGHTRLLIGDSIPQPRTAGPAPRPPRPRDAAYVLYTSGSTGRPKGVVVEHRSLASLLAGHQQRLIGPAERANNGLPLRVALTAATTFDASWDPLLWMIAGHELHLVDDASRRDPEALTAYLHTNAIDVLETTPSFLEQLRACGLFAPGRPRPRVLALGGEAVNEALWNELAALEDIAVWNLYGPTEATVDSVMGRITAGTRPHIGRPVDGMRTRVLDARLRPAAPGVTGELYLSGTGLARGYENRAPATAARFLPDPFGEPGARMYRTGDLVRRRAGHLEYVGRADGQVKVRGFRVETGEVEAALLRHATVAQAAVAVRPDASGAGRLVAWTVPCDGQDLSPSALRTFVAGRLPAYMVPSTVVPVPGLPLTVHGKVDFGSLPDGAPGSDEQADPPHSAQEEILCALFAETLGHTRVARTADFFDLGGHSLLATRLVGRIRSAFGVELPVRTLFEATTPAALAERLGTAGAARPVLRAAARPDLLPLSPAQQRLWFLHRMDPDDAAYHIPVAVRLTGTLDRDALRCALADVVARHESLRTLIQETDDVPRQTVLAPGDARPELPVTAADPAGLAEALHASAVRSFDLACELPLRAELFALADDQHVLLLTVHHIAADGWSMGPLAQDLAGAYSARVAGRAPAWTPLPVQYADYALWQRAVLGAADRSDSLAARQLAHWRKQLESAPADTVLPADRPRPARSSGRGGTVALRFSPETTEAVTRLARSTATSTFMVLHAALTALLHRIGAGDDITVGTPVAGRTDEELDGLVGFFVNTLALRVRTEGAPTFRELLGRVREADLAAYAHQDVPFERLVEELRPDRSLSRHPLFQVMLTLNNTGRPQLELPGLQAQMSAVDTGGAKFDLSLSLTERGEAGDHRLEGTLEFSRDLFDPGTARDLADWFARLVEGATAAPDTPVRDLALIPAAEQTRLLALGQGRAAHGGPGTVLDRFARTVAAARTSDIAVTAPDGSLSFTELDARSDRIAGLLADAGVRPGDPVVVLLPRCTDSVAALIGVLKAGGVYAPVDDSLPAARITAILDDARPRTVVAAADTAGRIPGPWHLTVLDSDRSAGAPALPAPGPTHRPGPDDPAYLIHTSGSTGRPKGVLVSHHSLARLLEHHSDQVYAPAARTAGRARLTAALTATLSFDAAWDPVLWMFDGHRVHLVDDLTRRDPEALVASVRADRIDVLETTPTHARQLLDSGLLADGAHHPAVLILGGEAVPPELWNELRAAPRTQGWNFYGPTEATVDTLETRLTAAARPVLGAPVTGTRVQVLDDALRPAPAGVVGDLYLAGDSLALGYPGRPAETARTFLPDPYGPPGSRMYRTGDRARRTRDDELEFAGRSDNQAKVRGFRVEPDEIAAVLAAHPRVDAAAVAVHGSGAGAGLTAYVVPADSAAPDDIAGLRDHAARQLPAYMVPSGWLTLERLPLTPSGKLDRAALPLPAPRTRDGESGRVPRTPREDVLCQLFAEVLGLDQVLIDDDFFALGGHSLLATRLIGRIRTALGAELGIRALFEAPTPAGLADRLDGAADSPLTTLLPLRTAGGLPPLFCVHPAGGLAWSYAGLLPHLDEGRPLYGLQTPNLDGAAPFPDSIEAMAAVYVAELRKVQPHGPYHLFGWSFGGNVVQEIAVQLQEAGERVALLTILDAFPVAPLDDLDSADRDTVFRALLGNLGVDGAALDTGAPVDATTVRDEFRRTGSPLGALEPATIDHMVDNFAGQARLMRAYTPRTFHGPALFFTAAEGRPADTFGTGLWAPYITGPIENHDVACAHAQMMQPAAREQIGTTVAAALRATHRTGQGDLS
ncbi:amino acid adenylation domain-containing protein [Streptomyces sp. NBC_01089]|uniref:amino acid adenylation domain-containing protein n=1 Tax=Streptomyces sp. NBC_01089 TaxID=2903747 RepID=UPI00386498DC|nr:amino acid adenylation domain-containing protein [Streptomyces sp. NBC_01089]